MEEQDKRLVVYVEDEPDMIELVRLILDRQPYELLGALGGKDGLNMIKEMHPDLVLLDLMMPDMDGWSVYQKMQADPDMESIPVIVVTARGQNIDRILGLRVAGVEDYIVKPFGPKELRESINKVFDKRAEKVSPPEPEV